MAAIFTILRRTKRQKASAMCISVENDEAWLTNQPATGAAIDTMLGTGLENSFVQTLPTLLKALCLIKVLEPRKSSNSTVHIDQLWFLHDQFR